MHSNLRGLFLYRMAEDLSQVFQKKLELFIIVNMRTSVRVSKTNSSIKSIRPCQPSNPPFVWLCSRIKSIGSKGCFSRSTRPPWKDPSYSFFILVSMRVHTIMTMIKVHLFFFDASMRSFGLSTFFSKEDGMACRQSASLPTRGR